MKKPQNQESEKQAVGINHYYAAARLDLFALFFPILPTVRARRQGDRKTNKIIRDICGA